MLSYRHAFHAGNHGDVLKHVVLTRTLTYLVTKDRPLLYLDTHAGAGMYDLQGAMPNKTQEATKGIALVWQEQTQAPSLVQPYLNVLKDYNPDGILRFYPGSPALAQKILRPIDRAICYELHPTDGAMLSATYNKNQRLRVVQTDGLAGLKACLPPLERRGLILLDPDYEQEADYRAVPAALKAALQRFSTGVYILWYPLLQHVPMTKLTRAITALKIPNILGVELIVDTTNYGTGMIGSGLWVVNPPWILQRELQEALPWLASQLGGTNATWRLFP